MAKVNLTLEVVGRRPDGYHELRSVFLRIGLADRLSVAAGWASDEDQLLVTGLPGCPIEGNLVLRAFDLVREAVDPRLPALRAELHKAIPLGGGLGGGSSDGAAAIGLAAAAWGIGLGPSESDELAATLGSDVPFFVADAPAGVVEGRGERVTELPPVAGGAGVLLAISTAELSTARAFARYDELASADRPAGSPTDRLASAFNGGLTGSGLTDMAAELTEANDLWPAAASLAPELAERRQVLERATAWPWLLSGSGPTLFCVLPTLEDAIEAGTRLAAARPPVLAGVMLCAVDLESPDNVWREP
jgi:4-diphosphocytidyl-2-C-methyl-D-erythritol kinase